MTHIHELAAYYQAGIGVGAVQLGVEVRQLSIGQENHISHGAVLEPFETWYRTLADEDTIDRGLVEDYVTVCLSGSAGHFIRSEARRCPLKRSLGNAGLKMKHLRRVWQCAESETDRAFAIAFSLLGDIDDGDTEAILYRLWHRATGLLNKAPQLTQLDRLVRELIKRETMPGEAVIALLKDGQA